MASNLHWRQRSRCSTLTPQQYDNLFFPKSGRKINEAKAFCKQCPVFDECLEFSLTNDCEGIWAGMNKTERESFTKFRDKVNGVIPKKKPPITHPTVRRRKPKRTNFTASLN